MQNEGSFVKCLREFFEFFCIKLSRKLRECLVQIAHLRFLFLLFRESVILRCNTIMRDALRDLVPFLQFRKRENTHGEMVQ